jgi:hypothetical protein
MHIAEHNSTAQHSTAQHNTTQHRTAQHSTNNKTVHHKQQDSTAQTTRQYTTTLCSVKHDVPNCAQDLITHHTKDMYWSFGITKELRLKLLPDAQYTPPPTN